MSSGEYLYTSVKEFIAKFGNKTEAKLYDNVRLLFGHMFVPQNAVLPTIIRDFLDEANKDFEIAKIVSAEKQPWDEEERLSMELKQILDWKKKYFGDPAK